MRNNSSQMYKNIAYYFSRHWQYNIYSDLVLTFQLIVATTSLKINSIEKQLR